MSEEHGFWNKTKNATNHLWKNTKKATGEVWAETKTAAENIKHKLHKDEAANNQDDLYEDYDVYEIYEETDDIHGLNENPKHKPH